MLLTPRAAIPLLSKFINDSSGWVRSHVQSGIDFAIEETSTEPDFRVQAYDLLLNQIDQNWDVATNDVVRTVVALDRDRAAVDLSSARLLCSDNPNLHRLIRACNHAKIILPEARIRSLLESSLKLAIGADCYPHQYVASEALQSLALTIGDAARPLLLAALGHEQSEIQEAAAQGLAIVAGIEDPVRLVHRLVREKGLVGLTYPQRVVYLAVAFDAEVGNGGIMQFFGNSSGDHAAETLDALRELGHPNAIAALTAAFRAIGPLARERDRDMRLAAFEGRYDELQASFGPLEDAFYQTTGLFRQTYCLYAVKHFEHFRV